MRISLQIPPGRGEESPERRRTAAWFSLKAGVLADGLVRRDTSLILADRVPRVRLFGIHSDSVPPGIRAMTYAAYDREAAGILKILPPGRRLGIIGSTSFWHADSQPTCEALGKLLAGLPNIVVLTGGVKGVGESVGRSFETSSAGLGHPSRVFHVLPRGESTWDYGQTFFAGDDMEERREVLGRLANIYIAIEGGPGTAHEARVGRARCALVIPIGRSGGFANALYMEMSRPDFALESTWDRLGHAATTPVDAARSAFEIANAFFDRERQVTNQ